MRKLVTWTLAPVVMAALGVWAAGCNIIAGSTEACGTVGCESGLTVTLTVDPTAVAAGMHTVDVTADGVSLSCAFTFPSPADVTAGGVVSVPCPSGLAISFQSAETCTTTQTPSSSTISCVPVPGKIWEIVVVAGTPSSVHLHQEVGGTAILDQTLAATYETVAPNGESCGPICHEGTAALTIP
jgi:hypothetical protein